MPNDTPPTGTPCAVLGSGYGDRNIRLYRYFDPAGRSFVSERASATEDAAARDGYEIIWPDTFGPAAIQPTRTLRNLADDVLAVGRRGAPWPAVEMLSKTFQDLQHVFFEPAPWAADYMARLLDAAIQAAPATNPADVEDAGVSAFVQACTKMRNRLMGLGH